MSPTVMQSDGTFHNDTAFMFHGMYLPFRQIKKTATSPHLAAHTRIRIRICVVKSILEQPRVFAFQNKIKEELRGGKNDEITSLLRPAAEAGIHSNAAASPFTHGQPPPPPPPQSCSWQGIAKCALVPAPEIWRTKKKTFIHPLARQS
ncbi:hypothetical protein V9T40_014785 [Parthenolecanium corni]|uniref:Uncharacterized protein n=1 Tax=Parthenolecanium corni TaxID=536013 RepID=A0AAN9T6M5_9HEMI